MHGVHLLLVLLFVTLNYTVVGFHNINENSILLYTSCKVNSLVYYYKEKEGRTGELNALMKEINPYALSRGVQTCTFPSVKSKIILIGPNGKSLAVYNPTKDRLSHYEVMHKFIVEMPPPLIHPIVLDTEQTQRHLATIEDKCIAAASTNEEITAYYEWVKTNAIKEKTYLFTLHTDNILLQLGHKANSTSKIYCF